MDNTCGTLVVSRHDLQEIVSTVGASTLMDELIADLSEALEHYDESRIDVVKREGFAYDDPEPGVLEWMPAMVFGGEAIVKVVGYNPGNPLRRGLPTVVSTINLYDIGTGRLVALLDGVLPTALRTGAASAIATRVLAHPESTVVGLVGCGAQAVTQLHALSFVMPVRQVLVYDIDPEASRSFPDRVAFLDLNVTVAAREDLERESDVVCTATSAPVGTGPVIDDRHLKPWVHVNAVGSDLPGKTELSPAFLRQSLVCPDFLEQAIVEGESQQLGAQGLGPVLGDLVKHAGQYETYRQRATVFDSTGYALEDIVVARLLLRYASALEVGRHTMIEGAGGDPKDPYATSASGAVEPVQAPPVGRTVRP